MTSFSHFNVLTCIAIGVSMSMNFQELNAFFLIIKLFVSVYYYYYYYEWIRVLGALLIG